MVANNRLFQQSRDTQLFAVRFTDGEIGYCSVMGMNDEYLAIAVYPGQEGLDSLRRLNDDAATDDIMALERMHSQDCMVVSFEMKSELIQRDIEEIDAYCKAKGKALRGKNAYPSFSRYRPGFERWYLEDAVDQRRMAEALEAALEVSDRLTREMKTPMQLGFTEEQFFDVEIPLLVREDGDWRWESHPLPPARPETWPPIVIDDLSRARLQKVPRKGEWAVRLFRYFHPVAPGEAGDADKAYDELTQPPFFAWTLMIVDPKTGMVLGVLLSPTPGEYEHGLTPVIVDTAMASGLPQKIIVTDDRTAMAMGGLCDALGIKLERKKRCSALQNALDDFYEHLSGMDDDDEDSMLDDDIDAMIELLKEPGIISQMPDALLEQILGSADSDDFPPELQQILYDEGVRRGIIPT